MPDESCRGCGGQLRNCTICAECRKPVSMICEICNTRTIEQVHALCFMKDLPQIDEREYVESAVYTKQAVA